MQKENVFLRHKLLLILFFLSFLVFLICHYKYALGLYFDMPAMLLGNMSQDDTFSKFIVFPDRNIRYFTNFLVAIPFNIAILFVKNSSAINILKVFSLSYFVVHFLGLLINYLIAIRTKRYDIATICFAFYTFFSIQNAIWACREVHIAILFYFALLSYFLSKTKLGLKDFIPVLVLIIYLFEAFEITAIFGLILFVFSILYTKKDRDEINRWYKVLIGLSGLFIFLYISTKTIIMSFSGHINLSQGTNEWFNASLITIGNLFTTNSLFTILGLIIVIFALYYKKSFDKILTSLIILLYCFIFAFLRFIHYIPQPMIELQNYSFVFWFIFPITLLLLILEYKKITINSEFLSNLITISCIIGIIGLIWQINTCFEFNRYITYLKDLMEKSQNVFVSIPKEDFENKNQLNFNTCFGTMHKSIFLSDEYVIKKIIIPDKNTPDNNEYCFSGYGNEYNRYDEENQFIYIQTSPVKLKNKYWDMSLIKEEFEQINN